MIPKCATLILDNGYKIIDAHKLMAYSTGTAPALTIIVQPGN